jgi:hypothetical protein
MPASLKSKISIVHDYRLNLGIILGKSKFLNVCQDFAAEPHVILAGGLD